MVDPSKMFEFKTLVEKHAVEEGGKETAVKDFFVYKSTKPQKQKRELYDLGMVIMASGKKRCFVNDQVYDYSVGSYLGVFLPIPVEVEEVNASPENPLQLVGLKMDLGKIAEMLLKLDRLETPIAKTAPNASGLFTAPLEDSLLEPVIRLLKTLDNPGEVALLSQGIVDEIYFRLLSDSHVGAIRQLIEHRGQFQQIARAVGYINQHIDAPVAIEELAEKANMSVSHFHKSFKDVMQMSPLQYAKSIKLLKAQALIGEGKKASQAGYMVGYNSPAQFSREYKRQFGYAPSETV